MIFRCRRWAIIVLLLIGVNQGTLCAKEPKRPPNFIFILADDLGWGDLGCYGHSTIKTPNLDQLAREGMLFTQYYAGGPISAPSRAALMTGHFPSRDRIFHNIALDPAANAKYLMPNELDPNLLTLADVLGEKDYRVGHFGKWNLSDPEKVSPDQYGIHEWKMMGKKWPLDSSELRPQSSRLIVDRVIRFIQENYDRPFLVNTWLRDVHVVHRPTKEQLERYKQLGHSGVDYPSAAQVYYSVVSEMDHQIGRLMKALEEMGLKENTVVIFSSDNGPEDTYWGLKQNNVGSAGPFRGRKRSLYEGGIRVPFIVRWPGEIPAGKVNETVLGSVDVLETFSALAGIQPPDDYEGDGEDMSAVFRGEVRERSKPLMWEARFKNRGYAIHQSPMLAVRERDWKLLMNPDGSRVELYDLKKDPMEVDNLAREYPDVVQDLSQELLAWHHSLPPGKISKKAGSNDYPWPVESSEQGG